MSAATDRFDRLIMQQCIAQRPAQFHTKDVSEDPTVRAAHPSEVGHRNYHAHVGKWLKANMGLLGLDELATRDASRRRARGSLWGKVREVAVPAATAPVPRRAAPPPAADAPDDLGPQYAGDDLFTARMRRHQSWFRAHVLGVPCGTGPQASSTSRYGNMLRAADGRRGLNFVSDAAFEAAEARIAAGHGAVDPFRLRNNLLSSMPLCFNLFGPLVADLELATRVLSARLPGEVAEVTRVLLEHAPSPASEFLADRTAFDAFIEYRQPDGALAAVGIETKLTERFSAKHYDTPTYRRWMDSPAAPWRSEAHGRVADVQHNQLWRDHLLAIAVRDHGQSPYAACRLALVHHPEDRACAAVVDGYAALLKPGDQTFVRWPLDRLLAAWDSVVEADEPRRWLSTLRTRYLDLARSGSGA